MNLGKWLVLYHQGQGNEAGVNNDIMQYITTNPTGIDTNLARSTAVNFFVNQTHQQPTVDEGSILNQWMSLIDGSQQPQMENQLTEQIGENYEHTIV